MATRDRATKSRSGSTEARQPASAAASTAQFQMFGDDPNTFPDPTVYHICAITPGMSEDEKLEILQVASYPPSDLHHLTAGTPPDADYSGGKENVKQSVTAQQFVNYVEPFIRPLNDEDVAFLRERGDRSLVFEMTARGPKPYKDVWTEEDGGVVLDMVDLMQPPNEARGTMEDVNDVTAESEDISAGPVAQRLLQLLRRQGCSRNNDEANGDVALFTNGISNGDADGDDAAATAHVNGDAAQTQAQAQTQTWSLKPPATFMPESAKPGWKESVNSRTSVSELPGDSVDKRVMLELKHIGFIAEDTEMPDFDAANDNEVAERLRLLQTRLKRMCVVNAARKAVVLGLTLFRMAAQEYMSIADDLDNQVNQAYLKRNRNAGKSKKVVGKKGQRVCGGGFGGGGGVESGRVVMADGVRSLLDRKAKWNQWIGVVVDYGRMPVPAESVFPKEMMVELEKAEVAAWDAEAGEA